MNTSALHTATEAFATSLSEVTAGDLDLPTPCEGWDVGDLYRHVLDEMQLCDTVIHTWDLARATGLECEVDDDVADLVLRRMEQIPDTARGEGMAFAVVRAPLEPGDSTLDRIVRLSGRIPRP
ncbi:maleylpyruvate isomerase N-terminal domain-containing protein [Isoptericola cucumis]|uniref:Mycothiol-dependent maleylpyruvate isomerase metal-binding domain-containing protein n=1 Tax=Isoptericola cucumis TaxID=1776856 RepID=A0ABQ2BBI0_9MICO|nr:maleylpyruvate isomerase N-terminal domain-containing protein [Isoptericola cucumis]GGI10863.1 hypothetical protein GCM10007368_33350 [Isoptericola cucumis]